MIRLAAVIALGWSGASVLTAAAWSVLRAAEKRHNAKAAANARAGLAAMGAACPDEVAACADCEADAAAIDALNDDELAALARALGVYVDRAEMTADFDLWEEQVKA